MPILNPQQAFNLLKYDSESISIIHFLKYFLPIASENARLDKNMIIIHQKFIKFFSKNIKIFSKIFNFTNKDLTKFLNLGNNDAYQILFEILGKSDHNEKDIPLFSDIKNILGNLTNKNIESIRLNTLSATFLKSIHDVEIDFPDESTFFFIPFNNKRIKCFISEKSYAVLTYPILNHESHPENIFLINLISLIINASGHSLVFCLYQKNNFSTFNEQLQKIDFSNFSESHIFTALGYYNSDQLNLDFFRKPFQKLGYVYIYAHSNFYNDNLNNFLNIQKTYLKVFRFSKKLRKIFKFKKDSIQLKNRNFIPKRMDLSGFLKKLLPINLCNVALYKSDDRIHNTTPEKISGIDVGEIDPKTFKYCNCKRVPIEIDDDIYYIEFPDLHLMNPELYVAEPMYLSKQNFDINIVEKVKDHYSEATRYFDKSKAKNTNIKLNIYEKMLIAFHYLHKYTFNENNENIKPYTSQIYAVYQAVSNLKNCDSKSKGIILQVQTGEGKSFIVQALAEHLARQGNTVHIATSNIILAARDFEKSYNYFRNTEKKFKSGLQKHFRPSILINEKEYKYIKAFIDENKSIDENEKKCFYSQENYNNPTNMNISVCLNDKPVKSNIVFSTFLNFEAFYLNQYEKNPRYVSEYMNNCYLIIDEADTILIDEITNGTILSKPMNSNAREVLEFIYKNYSSGNKNEESILKMIHKDFPECKDMTTDDVLRIFSDIEKICNPDFKKNYAIIPDEDDDKKTRIKKATKISPFDAEHKGIVEVNKEFSGFIHQLIGIKEKNDDPDKNENLIVQKLSMNYLFISHPIYVNKYKGVCGVTGTAGNQEDINLLSDFYYLSVQEVPRHQMNLRNDLPKILCDTNDERIERICLEITNLHKNEYPVLVVFNDYKEIDQIKKKLIDEYNIENKKILIFDGRSNQNDESIKKTLENEGGKPGVITLGTNFCGRGVSIGYVQKPLYVIVTYYNEDNRSIYQVLGRAGRNGHLGMARIICTKEMYYKISTKLSRKTMKIILDEFKIKNLSQIFLIDKIKQYHPWIFDESQYTEKISKSTAYKLRKCQININRITAYRYKFPICMSLETFFDIQSQRIFSIKNCPECKYTWNLFRNYMRELIYESWSIFIDSVDNNYKIVRKNGQYFHPVSKKIIDYSQVPDSELYGKFFKDRYEEYENLLFNYIYRYRGPTVVDSFMKIHNIVTDNYENLILSNIPDSVRQKSKIKGKKDSYTSFRIGFFPMCLAENSGMKITELSNYEEKKADEGRLYIIDPELQYLRTDHRYRFSITKVIDKIFDAMQEKVDNFLQGLFGIRFFLRRTLGGCELGICVVPPYDVDDKIVNCLVDRKPLIMLTICTKSTFFWLAGTLLVVLVFITTITTLILTKYLSIKDIGKKVLDFLKKGFTKFLLGDKEEEEDNEGSKGLIGAGIDKAFEKIIDKLKEMITKNLKNKEIGLSLLFETIINMFVPMENDTVNEKLSDNVFAHFKINDNAKEYLKSLNIFGRMLKIGILFILLIATFILNFKQKIRVKYESFTKNNASSYKSDPEYCDVEMSNSYENTEKCIKKEMGKNID